MADKTIGELVAATAVTSTDLFVLQQNNTAKKLTAQILENWLVALADGHGGIQSIVKTSSSGFVDTYTITLSDETTTTFTVTNGKAISSVTTYYAVSSDGSTAPISWSTTRQSMTSTNRYLWSYQTIAFNDNSTIDTVKTVIGVWGDKGDTGAAGRGITDLEQTSRVPGSYTLYTFTMSDGTTETFYSYDGVGISGIEKTSTSGLVDTYTISYTNGTTTSFTVSNAKSIVSITKTSTVGLVDTYTILFNDETSTMFTVSNGKSISSISKTSTSGLVDTYTISMNDGTTTTFTVTNGSSISTIAKTSTVGLVDTYTVTLTDGSTTTFTVTNAKSIVSVTMVSGTHAAGTTDTYRITFNDGDTTDFTVYNGTNGTGSVSTVDGIPSNNQNVTLLLTGNGPPTESTVGQFKQRYFDLSNQILYICVGIDTSSNPATYSWAGTGVPVDSSLSSTSENPVQNKVITAKVGTTALTTTATDLSGAVNELNAGKYEKPSAGIPKADLASSVQTSLGKADTALQSVPNTYRTAAAQDVIDAQQDANIGIVQNTDTATQSISKGQYVIWHGALYTASSAIASGNTLSNSNLTAVTGGGLNHLNSALSNENSYQSGVNNVYVCKMADGTLIMSGRAQVERNVGINTTSVQFPVQSTIQPNIVTSIQTSTYADRLNSSVGSVSQSGDGFDACIYNSGAGLTGTAAVHWIAIGKWK